MIAAGLSADDFRWSGINTDAARREGGKKLCDALTRAADNLDACEGAPLTVNIVAHSHGGNVVLEAMALLDHPGIQIGRVVFLGTPILSAGGACRPIGVIFSLILFEDLVFPIWFWILLPIVLISLVIVGQWIIAVIGWTLDKLSRFALPLMTPFRRSHIYGPKPKKLRKRLRGNPITLMVSREDEAAVLLALSSGPQELYRSLWRQKGGT